MQKIKTFAVFLLISFFFSLPVYARDYAADLVSVQGNVEHLPAGTTAWERARDSQELYPQDTIRTGGMSRAAVLFIDQTQIKLSENTTLEIRNIDLGKTTQISWGRSARSLYKLASGKIWIRSGGETLDLQVDTPIASATIRGTEFVVHTDKEKTTVTVIDGAVNLKNAHGEVLVNSREEGIAEIDKPPYKRVIINPEDAVQWALYYPGNICHKDYQEVPPGEMAVIEKFLVLYREKKISEAIDLVKKSLDSQFPNSACLLTQLAFGQLLVGKVTSAKENIDKALAIDQDFSLAHSILSNIYLVQNNKEEAEREAELAVKTNPSSPSAYVSLAWVRQSHFDIPGAIYASRKAVELDSKNVQALVTLCRLLFGSDRIAEASRVVDQALEIVPEECIVNATKGYLLLAKGRTEDSIEYFEASIRQDSTQGLGHLGLGLAFMRLKNIPRGLKEMLTATLLEPKISLYQSYMGKTYYQVAKEYAEWGVSKEEALNYDKYIKLAEKTLDYASYLDPRDPTPYLYGSIIETDLNRPVDAIEKLDESIALNDNRAVYRSRLLLDRDLATENISLAQAYDTMGLCAWGSNHALKSYESDFSVSGAHRFLGSTYLRLRDRVRAAGSEILQARVLMPVNENSFNTYNNYTSLFQTPEYNGLLASKFGEDETMEQAAALTGTAGKYAFSQLIVYESEDGYLPSNDDSRYTVVNTMLKYATGMRSHLFGSFDSVLSRQGDHASTWAPFENNPGTRYDGELYRFGLGYYHQLDPDTDLVMFLRAKQDKYEFDYKYYDFAPEVVTEEMRDSSSLWNGQIELIKRWEQHQVVFGLNRYDGTESYDSKIIIPPFEEESPTVKVPQRYTTIVLRDFWKLTRQLGLDLAVKYDEAEDGKVFYDKTIETSDVNPQMGLVYTPFEKTTLRAAVIKSTQHYFEDNILPTNTAGFIIDHDEFSSSKDIEYAAAWDQEIGEKTFFTISGSYRERKTPEFTLDDAGTIWEITQEDKFSTANFILNRIINKSFALSAEYSFMKTDDRLGERDDHQVKLHLGFVHPSGWSAEFTETYIRQENETFAYDSPFDSSFWISDLSLSYEFSKKRGKISLTGENLFDDEFKYVSDPIALDIKRPDRRAIIKAELYF